MVFQDGEGFVKPDGAYRAPVVLDNLIHRLDVAETVVAFTTPGDRLVEYPNAAHSRFLTHELLPELESSLPLVGTRAEAAVSAGCDPDANAVTADDIGRSAFGIFKRGKELIGKTVGIAGGHLTGDEMAAFHAEPAEVQAGARRFAAETREEAAA